MASWLIPALLSAPDYLSVGGGCLISHLFQQTVHLTGYFLIPPLLLPGSNFSPPTVPPLYFALISMLQWGKLGALDFNDLLVSSIFNNGVSAMTQPVTEVIMASLESPVRMAGMSFITPYCYTGRGSKYL